MESSSLNSNRTEENAIEAMRDWAGAVSETWNATSSPARADGLQNAAENKTVGKHSG